VWFAQGYIHDSVHMHKHAHMHTIMASVAPSPNFKNLSKTVRIPARAHVHFGVLDSMYHGLKKLVPLGMLSCVYIHKCADVYTYTNIQDVHPRAFECRILFTCMHY
jgi:hypothetical protein